MVPRDEIEDDTIFPSRDFGAAVDVFSLSDGNSIAFHVACRNASLKPIYHPFWESLPFTNIFVSITPDILHQLHQGILKHMVCWLATLASNEINMRSSRLLPNHNAWHFHSGFTWLSKLTGQEHRDIAHVLLGVVVNLALPSVRSSARLARIVCALLDFIYLSQYPVHTTASLNAMGAALCQFHEDKDVVIELGVQEYFKLPKLHSLLHYTRSITLFGTADNYNTEQSERLHIDFTKKAYRASNFKDKSKQMTTWLERQEAVHRHAIVAVNLRATISQA